VSLFLFTILILPICFALIIFYGYFSSKIKYNRYAKQAQYTLINGLKIHTHRTGQGGPATILEAGGGDCYLTWNLVQSELSKFSDVMSYDRAGLGLSDPSPTKRQLSQYVEELKQILIQTDLQSPFVLVGHSLGGLIILYYALKYPADVAGIVLVDSAHEKQAGHSRSLIVRSIKFIKIGLSLSWLGTLHLLAYLRIPKNIFANDIVKQYRCLQSTRKSTNTTLSEITEYLSGFKPFFSALRPILNNIPIAVITRGNSNNKKINPKLDLLQKELQKEFLVLSDESKHIIAEKSGHYIQWTEPNLIVDAVHWVREKYNKNRC
jgi:pimeloyl-ACP methyl ester carboxylesterase